MKIHETLSYLLIIGSLSLTTAQVHLPTREQMTAQIPRLQNVSGFNTFDTSNVDIEEIRKQLQDKCEKNGGPTAFETFIKGGEYFIDCVSSIVDVRILELEMQDAAPQGELDTVFNKYCARVPRFEKCVRNFTDTIGICLESEEKQSLEYIRNVTDSLLEFVCHNEGDRIAMFIAAGGLECIQEKQPEITVCGDQIFGKYSSVTYNPLPPLIIDQEDCKDMERFKDCVVPVLETCSDPTPGTVLDSLFTYVKKITPCEKLINNPPPLPPPSKGTSDPKQTVEELYKKSLVKQIEAAEAQVRAAHAQEQAARVVEKLASTFLRRYTS